MCQKSSSPNEAYARKFDYHRETAERAHSHTVASARQEGHHTHLARTLLRQVIRRFGTLHDATLVHLACASPDDLRCAADSLSDATTLTSFLESRNWPLAPISTSGAMADSAGLVSELLKDSSDRSLAMSRLIELREEQYYAAAEVGCAHAGDATERAAALEAARKLRAACAIPSGSSPADPEVIALGVERDPAVRAQLHQIAAARYGAGMSRARCDT
jgi:hypothetical protein